MPVSASQDTILVLNGIGINRWAFRGLTETLRPIPEAAAGLTRSINGTKLNWTQPQFQKFALTLTCTDFRMPPFDGVWPGAEVTVDCVSEFVYPTSVGSPGRTAVPGSTRVEGSFTLYRPRLDCVFLGFNEATSEWAADVAWEAEFEEI